MRNPISRHLRAMIQCLGLCLSLSAQGQSPRDPWIFMSRGMCYGTCPVYTLSIHEDGRVVFQGEHFTKVKGIQTHHLSPEGRQELAAALAESGFFDLSEKCCDCYDVTCASTVVVAVQQQGRAHRIVHYHGCRSAPERLSVLEDRIDAITGSDRWIGTGQERDDRLSPSQFSYQA